MKGLLLISPAGLAPHPPPERVVPPAALGLRLRLLDRLWGRNYTPQAVARALGHFGPGLVSKVVNRRFGEDRWDKADATAISEYFYHISALPASGEFAMNTLLMACFVSAAESPETRRPRVLAREPLTAESFAHLRAGLHASADRDRDRDGDRDRDRDGVGGEGKGSGTEDSPVDLTGGGEGDLSGDTPHRRATPLLVLYGDSDWLSFPEAAAYVRGLQDSGLDARLAIVRGAGHHLYMDNPEQYHDEIHGWVRDRVLGNAHVKKINK
jgi:pimeloyl-ACP methyl ester carboxylesterase